MIRSIAILRNLRTLGVLNHFNLRYLNNLTDYTINQDNTIKLREKSSQSNVNLDNLIVKLKDFKNLNDLIHLFDLIEPHKTKLTNEDLKIIMKSIVYLYRRLRANVKLKTMIEFSELMQRSNAFKSILNQVNQQINKLDEELLRDLIGIYFLTKQHPKSEIVSNTFNELSTRLNSDNLELDTILDYLIGMRMYVFSSANSIDRYFNLYESYLNVCKHKVLDGKFNFNQQTIIKLYSIFLNGENDLDREIINYLNQKFMSSTDFVFDFKASVKLLKKIKQTHANYKLNRFKMERVESNKLRSTYDEIESRYKDQRYFAESLNLLIEKLNDQIYQTFSKQLDEERLNFYLYKVHSNVDSLNKEFVNFYDNRLFQFLIDYSIKNHETKFFSKQCIFCLAKNYAKFGIFDERLMRLIYHLYFTNDQFRFENGKHLYLFLTRYRLPFVDQNCMAELTIFHTAESFRKNKIDYLDLLVEFVLNDVTNKDLFYYLIKRIDINPLNSRKEAIINKQFFKKLILAKTYLFLRSDLDNELMKSIELKLDECISKLDSMKLKLAIDLSYIKLNDKLQFNGYYAYQSNSIYLDAFAIYDKSKRDLISLSNFEINASNTIDRIPLHKYQQL